MKSLSLAIAVSMAAVLAFANISRAVTITPSSPNDAFSQKDGSYTAVYYDTTSTIGAKYYYYDYASPASSSVIKKFGFIEFSIADIDSPPDGIYTLNLYFTGSGTYGATALAGTVNHVANSSTASGIAKNDRLSGVDIAYTVSAGALGWVSIDVTSYVTADITSGYDYSCFYLNYATPGTSPERGGWFDIYSADSAINKPYLSVPEPSTCAAFAGLGVLGLALVRRRRA